MAENRFHALLRQKVEERIESLSASIISGASNDYASYREMVGVVRGFVAVLELADEVEKDYQ